MKSKNVLTIIGLLCILGLMPVGMAMASETTGNLSTTDLETGPDGTVLVSPTPSPSAGTYSSTQNVTLTASGATAICYSIDGTNPVCASAGTTCTAGTLYPSAVSITSTKTMRYRSCYPNNLSTSVSTSKYTISGGTPPSGGGGGGGGGADKPETSTGSVNVSTSLGGKTTVTSGDGHNQATVDVPAYAVSNSTKIDIKPTSKSSVSASASLPSGKSIVGNYVYNYTAIQSSQALNTFTKNITLTFTYTEAQIEGADESTLKIYYWNETTGQWVAMPSTVDAANNRITVYTNHFTYFAIMIEGIVEWEEEVPAEAPADEEESKPLSEMSITELKAKVAELQALLVQLLSKLAALQGGGAIQGVPASFTFTKGLQYGDSDPDVAYLKAVLDAEVTHSSWSGNQYFGAGTKTAVIDFQNKYASEVLAPLGLTKGTGYVGASTRDKMNKLLGH